jgi:hypothetical protein
MNFKTLLAWLAVGAAAVTFLIWALPQVTPFEPDSWEVSRDDAEATALELARDLGELPDGAFVIVNRLTSDLLQLRLDQYLDEGGSLETLRASRLFPGLKHWAVSVWDPKATQSEWAYRARVSPTGKVLRLERQMKEDAEAGALDPQTARQRADRLLDDAGFDRTRFSEPQVRATDRANRTDLTLRYVDNERLLGERFTYGVEVKFGGDQLLGFSDFFDDPDEADLISRVQSVGLWQFAWIYFALLLAPLTAVPFVRRYHAGVVGVRRGLQISGVVLAAGLVAILFTAKGISEGIGMGALSKPATAVAVIFLFTVSFYLPMALVSFLGWSVGESLLRQSRGHKLASFDALFRGQWRNATFARAALQGVICGPVILSAAVGLLLLAPKSVFAFDLVGAAPAWASTQWWALPVIGFSLAYSLYTVLFGQLFLIPWLASHLGRHGPWLGPAAALLISALVFFPLVELLPVGWTLAVSLVFYGASMLVFMRFGLFTSLVAMFVGHVLPVAIPFAVGGHPSMQLNAGLLLLVAALPALLSLRYLFSGEEFIYRYEDIPPHVRRIAERERHKVELETARGIQSSILPELPPQLNGVQLSHRYLPATEVGGDFYDVLALEDGRLAVAVGDVAGHGVSSGLVMSMAKSALSVQVTFNPDVEAVFTTLNRMVYQSARKRLLTTLCYALIDPQRHEMFFASAGHLFPYRVTRDGTIEALESISYPLGVRERLEIRTRMAKLAPGDKLFLYSDGVVEASPEGSSEQFGFERLEQSLGRHAHRDVHGLRDGVLADLAAFAGSQPLEDDLTLLVLALP